MSTRVKDKSRDDIPKSLGIIQTTSASSPTLNDGHHNGDDDDGSDSSSIVNNPSILSQTPDRYGFLGGEQYTHESCLHPQLVFCGRIALRQVENFFMNSSIGPQAEEYPDDWVDWIDISVPHEPTPPAQVIRRRELKWLHMLSQWDHFMRRDFKTVRSRCRKGIPRSTRGRAWFYLTGGVFLAKKNPNLFADLLRQEGKPQCIEDIRKDVHRQFPLHEIFTDDGYGQEDLFRVLKAYSILNPEEGYCQAHAPIAATLLMHMTAEDAFWCLQAICDKYLKGYYLEGMQALKLDGDILFGLLKRVAPSVHKHLKKQKIDPVLYMTEWFLCAFTRTLPWSTVLRVWDMFLCEGVKVLFRVALVLLKYTLGRSEVLKRCPTMYETLPMLKTLPGFVTHEQFMVYQIGRLDITDDQMRKEHFKQLLKQKKQRQHELALEKKQENARLAAEKRGGGKHDETDTTAGENINEIEQTEL